ncbi:MAG: hypothetical protein JXN65_10155 [Clostridia bacterium]|nr:hypothetical protein [Clostridia bacterium]
MKKYRKVPLWIYITAATVPIVIFVLAVSASSNKLLGYNEFKTDFVSSVNYANENDSLRAKYDGINTKIIEENSQTIAETIMRGGFLVYEEPLPSSEPILFDFGNGDIMRIWRKDEESVIIQYVRSDNEEIIFATADICRFVDFERLISEDWGNPKWE